MAFRFKKSDPTVEQGVRRIAAEQFDRAVTAALGGGDEAAIVHDVRTRCKQLRGLVRLVRDDLDAYGAANAAVRDAAAGLSALRDRGAMVETCTWLAEGTDDDLGRAAASGLGRALAADAAAPQSGADGRAKLAEFAEAMAAARDAARDWRVAGDGFEPLAHGLVRTLDDAAEAMRTARKSHEIEAFHAWRKSVKYHWYHARLLAPVWPAVMEARIGVAKQLGEALGRHHDLAVLGDFLSANPGALDAGGEEALRRHLAARAAGLERDAFALGGRLFAERPKRLARRWGAWWDLWRKETADARRRR